LKLIRRATGEPAASSRSTETRSGFEKAGLRAPGMGRSRDQAGSGLEQDHGRRGAGGRRVWEKTIERERRFRRDAVALLRAVEGLNAAGQLAQVVEAVRAGARELLRGEQATIRCSPDPGGTAESPVMLTLETWSLEARKAIWLENAHGIQDLALPALADGSVPGAAVATPLFHSGRPCGVIAIYFQSPRLFTRAAERLLQNFMGPASAALERAAGGAREETAA